jgi:hypothetical protein
MGWFKADPVSARAGSAGVVVSLLRPPSAKAMTLRMRLGREAMRRTGWAADRRVELLWGDEGHAGKVMLRPAEAGPRLRFPHKRGPNFLETTFGHVPRGPIPGAGGAEWTLPAEVRPSAEAEWRVEENALVVTLPREWWEVTEPAAAPATPRVETRPFPPSVTAPPRPAADDRIERVISMLERGLSTEEVRQHERCSPQFVHDCRELLAKRRPGRVHPGQRTGVQPQMAGTREKAPAVNGGAA